MQVHLKVNLDHSPWVSVSILNLCQGWDHTRSRWWSRTTYNVHYFHITHAYILHMLVNTKKTSSQTSPCSICLLELGPGHSWEGTLILLELWTWEPWDGTCALWNGMRPSNTRTPDTRELEAGHPSIRVGCLQKIPVHNLINIHTKSYILKPFEILLKNYKLRPKSNLTLIFTHIHSMLLLEMSIKPRLDLDWIGKTLGHTGHSSLNFSFVFSLNSHLVLWLALKLCLAHALSSPSWLTFTRYGTQNSAALNSPKRQLSTFFACPSLSKWPLNAFEFPLKLSLQTLQWIAIFALTSSACSSVLSCSFNSSTLQQLSLQTCWIVPTFKSKLDSTRIISP